MKKLKIWWYKIVPTYKILEEKVCSYAEADKLIKVTRNLTESEQWQISHREDHNYNLGFVWICRKIRITGKD